MRISVNVRTRVRPGASGLTQELDSAVATPEATASPSVVYAARAVSPFRLLAGFALLAACLYLLWIDFGFARYAFTGFRWTEADGTVLSIQTTNSPRIEFIAPNGEIHTFTEDYLLICGRRSLCFQRDFTPGQIVPIVYDPSEPQYAYVHDWALYSNAILWFVEVGFALLFALLLFVAFRRKPLNFSVRIGKQPEPL